MTKRRARVLGAILICTAFLGTWIYSNRPRRDDLSRYAPADSLAYIEVNNLADVANGITEADGWRSLSKPLGVSSGLAPNVWLLRLARWTGIGSADTLLFARCQLAIVFSGAQGTQAGDTLTIKPLATLIVETHTTQRRMRATIEKHIEDLARRVYQNPTLLRKQTSGFDIQEWQAADETRQICFAFADTTVIVSNDESSVVRALEARDGKRRSLRDSAELAAARQSSDGASGALFGFVTQSGVKSILQAYAFYRGGMSPDAVTAARIFSDTIGGVIMNIAWTSRFTDGMVEDRCLIQLVDGVADKLRSSMVPDRAPDLSSLAFVPPGASSVSLYQVHDAAAFWTDVNVAIASHSDVVGAIAARPMLRGILKPYGIDDPDVFARAVGPHFQVIRIEEGSPAVLIAEVFDRAELRKIIALQFGVNPPIEHFGESELLLWPSHNRAAAFVDNHFMIGPAESVRRCLRAKTESDSLSSQDAFRKSQQLIDVSQTMTGLTFTNDKQQAISFIEIFATHERSAFATEGPAIEAQMKQIPYAVSISTLKGSTLDWTSRSQFGLLGSLLVKFAPELGKIDA